MQATFVVVEPKLTPNEYKVELPAMIGRGRDVQIKFTHGLVSRQHCELFEDGGGIMVRDLGSRNGTYIGGRRVEMAPLEPGDLLTVGGVTLRAFYGDDADVALAADAADERSQLADTVPMEDTMSVEIKPLSDRNAPIPGDDDELEWLSSSSDEPNAADLSTVDASDASGEIEISEFELNESHLDDSETSTTSSKNEPPKQQDDDDDFSRFLDGLK